MIDSRMVAWFTVWEYVQNVTPETGSWPRAGTPSWAALDDDDPATLAHRMEQYAEHTEPLLAFYESRGLLRRINAGLEAEEVFFQIEAVTHQAA